MKIAPTIIALLLLALGATAQAQNIEQLKEKAEQGDPEAQNLLGNAYYDGIGVPENYAQAVYWYRKASMQGHAQAQWNIGHSYFLGEGVPEDLGWAYSWFILAKATGGLDEEHTELTDKVLDVLKDLFTHTQIKQAQQIATQLHEEIQANIQANTTTNQP
ncbi:MAG: tetratricopeptide repeat protein [Bacteroidetes bacterium]|nr:tetratricopeptide repeat protein [Bacteroidota bacterium]